MFQQQPYCGIVVTQHQSNLRTKVTYVVFSINILTIDCLKITEIT